MWIQPGFDPLKEELFFSKYHMLQIICFHLMFYFTHNFVMNCHYFDDNNQIRFDTLGKCNAHAYVTVFTTVIYQLVLMFVLCP